MRGDVVLKTKYPEYINGVKQVQNPLHRLFIRVWYSDWFRLIFILIPIWLIPVSIIMILCNVDPDICTGICIVLYITVFMLGLTFNDYSNLRRIGLDEYHRKIEED